MAEFDPERYLRLAGERLVLDRNRDQRSGWTSPMADIASALVAVDAITRDRAMAIVAEYEMAMTLRGSERSRPAMFRGGALSDDDDIPPLPPARMVRCAGTVQTSWGTITPRYARLSADEVSIAITAVSDEPDDSSMPPIGGMLVDDQGNRSMAGFSGGGGRIYEGELDASGLSSATAWLELDGHRIDLEDVTPTPTEVEGLPASTVASRYLDKVLVRSVGRGPGRGDPSGIESTIEVLVDAGAVAPDADEIRQVRAVVQAMTTGDRSDPDLPAPWASILVRGTGSFGIRRVHDPARRTFVLGAEVAPIDGVHLRIEAVDLNGGEVAIHVVASPGSALGSWHGSVSLREITWWAGDDRGNHYLGSIGNSGGSDRLQRGTVNLMPALDRAATVLRLLPTGQTQRAVIEVRLDDSGSES